MNRLLNSRTLFKGAARSWRRNIEASAASGRFLLGRQVNWEGESRRSESWGLGLRASWTMRLRHDGIIVSVVDESAGIPFRDFMGSSTGFGGLRIRLTEAFQASLILAIRGNKHRVVKSRYMMTDDKFKVGDGADKVAAFLEKRMGERA